MEWFVFAILAWWINDTSSELRDLKQEVRELRRVITELKK